jgi:hypothetical protein
METSFKRPTNFDTESLMQIKAQNTLTGGWFISDLIGVLA